MPEDTFGTPGAAVLKCEQCGMHDQVVATYDCTNCDSNEELGPKPDGVPVSRPCPGCGMDVTGKVLHCKRCNSDSD